MAGTPIVASQVPLLWTVLIVSALKYPRAFLRETSKCLKDKSELLSLSGMILTTYLCNSDYTTKAAAVLTLEAVYSKLYYCPNKYVVILDQFHIFVYV